jgi:squalene cyclase
MQRARAVILDRGGVARTNVFTPFALALFGRIPRRGVLYIPVEIKNDKIMIGMALPYQINDSILIG